MKNHQNLSSICYSILTVSCKLQHSSFSLPPLQEYLTDFPHIYLPSLLYPLLFCKSSRFPNVSVNSCQTRALVSSCPFRYVLSDGFFFFLLEVAEYVITAGYSKERHRPTMMSLMLGQVTKLGLQP